MVKSISKYKIESDFYMTFYNEILRLPLDVMFRIVSFIYLIWRSHSISVHGDDYRIVRISELMLNETTRRNICAKSA